MWSRFQGNGFHYVPRSGHTIPQPDKALCNPGWPHLASPVPSHTLFHSLMHLVVPSSSIYLVHIRHCAKKYPHCNRSVSSWHAPPYLQTTFDFWFWTFAHHHPTPLPGMSSFIPFPIASSFPSFDVSLPSLTIPDHSDPYTFLISSLISKRNQCILHCYFIISHINSSNCSCISTVSPSGFRPLENQNHTFFSFLGNYLSRKFLISSWLIN